MSIKVTLKPIKGENFTVDANPEDKISDLKKKIAEAKSDYPAETQKLIYSGKILGDDSTLGESGYQASGFIVIMVTKAKAAPAAEPAAAPAAAPAPAAEPATAPAAAPAATPAATDQAQATMVTGAASEATITQLCDMGFGREEVIRCLQAAFGNPDRAVEYLMSGIPEGILAPAGGAAAPPPAAATAGASPTPASPPAAAGGGAFPAMPPPGTGGGGGGGPLPPALEELRNNPQFAQLAGMVAQNPQMLAQMLPAIQQSNPEIVQAIQQNPEAFMRMLQEATGGGGGGVDPTDPVAVMLAAADAGGPPQGRPGGPGGPAVIRLTEEEQAAVERLCALGFDRQAAAQAYLACDKNEELAANFLFDNGGDMMSD